MASRYQTFLNIVKLGRLRFLWFGFSLYLMGALLAVAAGAVFGLDRFVFGYAVLLAGHLSVHYSNDYFDYEADRKAMSGTLSGGSGVLPEHPELLPFSKWLALSLAVLSVLLGAAFTVAYSFPAAFFGFTVFGNLLCWFYTAPPVRLAYRGLGEVATMLALGFLMPAIGDFSQYGSLSPLFMAFTIPLLLYGLFFIVNVEIPDMEGDIAGGKNNFVARHGRAAGFAVAGLICLLATASIAALAYGQHAIDFRPVLLWSLVPLLPALYSLAMRPRARAAATRLAQANVGCYLLFILLTDAYLVFIRL